MLNPSYQYIIYIYIYKSLVQTMNKCYFFFLTNNKIFPMATKGLDGKQLALSWSLELSVICSLWLPLPNEKNIHSADKVLVVQWWPLVFWQSRNEVLFVSGLPQCHIPFGFQNKLWSHWHISTRSCLRNMLSSVPVTQLWSSTVIKSGNFQPHKFFVAL